KGLALVVDEDELAVAFRHALAEARSNTVLVEERVGERELTVNAFSVDGRFHSLTVTDRMVAEPPAFGVALAHVWPSETAPGAVEGGEEAAAGEGVVWVRVYREPGHEFDSFRRGSDRAGAVLAIGDSRREALERAGRAAERIRFVTADAEALVHNPP